MRAFLRNRGYEFIMLLLGISMLLCSCEMAVSFVSYEKIRDYLLYDHIMYEGTDYYIMDKDVHVPDDLIPFADQTISVVLVDKNGMPYDEERTEEARLYQNDVDMTYIYYYSTTYTKDKSLASKHYGFIE